MTTRVIPPNIMQKFSSDLLALPMPKFRNTKEDLWMIYIHIVKKLIVKSRYNARWHEKCMQLEQEFLEIYERIKKKEEDLEREKKDTAKKPFYYITMPSKGQSDLFRRLGYRAHDSLLSR